MLAKKIIPAICLGLMVSTASYADYLPTPDDGKNHCIIKYDFDGGNAVAYSVILNNAIDNVVDITTQIPENQIGDYVAQMNQLANRLHKRAYEMQLENQAYEKKREAEEADAAAELEKSRLKEPPVTPPAGADLKKAAKECRDALYKAKKDYTTITDYQRLEGECKYFNDDKIDEFKYSNVGRTD